MCTLLKVVEHRCQKMESCDTKSEVATVTSSSQFSSRCSFSLYELLSLYLVLFLTLPHITFFTPRLRAPELQWEGHIHTDTKTHTQIIPQLSPPTYTGVRIAHFSFSCGNNLITEGWEQIQPNTKRFSTEKRQQKKKVLLLILVFTLFFI